MRAAARRARGRATLPAAWLLAASMALPLQAQVRSPADYLARMDADRDGRVSLPEYQAWMGYAFEAMDRDRDGVLSAAELPGGKGVALSRSGHRARIAERFRRQDVDGDGFLSARELAAPPR